MPACAPKSLQATAAQTFYHTARLVIERDQTNHSNACPLPPNALRSIMPALNHDRPLNPPTPELIERFIAIVGRTNAITDAADQQAYLTEWRGLYHGKTPLILRPGTTEEVAKILALANEARIAVVTQGGNTGLVGGQIPSEDATEIVVATNRLTAIRSVDPTGHSMTVEAGVTLAAAQAEAEQHGRLFPLSLASEGSCTIGGNLATNAGGVNVLAYGNARDLVYGLEVVLADGRVWNGLRALKKDNTGYDLKDLFIGSEGTLGIMTAAVLKLFPRPAEQATALVAVPSLDAMRALFENAEQHAGNQLTAFEFMSSYCLDLVTRHVPDTRNPLAAPTPWTALIEVSSPSTDGRAATTLERLLSSAIESGHASDAIIAANTKQQRQLWRLREEISSAQRPEGGSIKHDISVPPGRIPEFVTRADKVVEKIAPGARPVIFGHFGDGNVHYNVTQPPDANKADYLGLWAEMNDAVHAVVVDMEGSFSAEHGIGRLKRETLGRLRSPVEIALMRSVKAALDPNGILNPGKLVSSS